MEIIQITSIINFIIFVLVFGQVANAGQVTHAGHATHALENSQADHYLEEGLRHYGQGDFERAIINELEAVRLFNENGKPNKQIEAMISLSHAYQSSGRFKEALAKLEEVLALAEEIGDSKHKSIILSNIGSIYTSINQYDKAEDYVQEALALVKEAGDYIDIIPGILNNLGNLQMARGEYSGAIGTFKEGLSLAEEAGNIQLVARTSANCARAYLFDDSHKEAFVLLNQSLQKHLELDSSHNKAFGLINVGQSYRDLSVVGPEFETECKLSAYRAFNESATVAQEIGDYRAASFALGYMGSLYENDRRYNEALQLTRRALFAAQQVDFPESLYLWQWQTGRLLKAQGEIDTAILAYENAVSTLQAIRQGISEGCTNCGNTSFAKTVEPVYFGLADLLLQKATTLKKREEIEDCLVKARDTIELLKTAELRDYFQDPCVDAYQAKATSLDTISKNSAVIYVISLPERLEILISLSSGMKHFLVNVDSEEFAHEVRLFRKRLEKRTTRQFMFQARKLYDWLIRPIEEELVSHEIDTLIFVPDKTLRIVPMAALHDGNQFLISKYALATTQGLSLTDPQPMEHEGLDILLTGLTESVQGFPALANVAGEIEDIHSLYGGAVLKNQKFIVPNMKDELANTQYSIVHIASHGEFFGDASKTFLLTWDDRLSMDRLAQLIKISRFREKPVELLTLSACQTASGDDRAALGLAGIAIKAGARSALATLWYVNDEASSKLVVEFYRQLKENLMPKAKSLQRAQVELLSDRRYQHPSYWSSFLLIGNWL